MMSPHLLSEFKFVPISKQEGFVLSNSFLTPIMSAASKQPTPTTPIVPGQQDWTKAKTPELQSDDDGEEVDQEEVKEEVTRLHKDNEVHASEDA